MSNQHKRVNFSIYLDPINSKTDRYALGLMGEWVKERKALAADPTAAIELHHRVHMHKDIYLAGVFLYLMSPRLCEQLSTSLSEETVNLDMLKHQLRLCGFNADAAAAPAFDANMLDALKGAADMGPLLQELGDIKAQLADIAQNNEHVGANDVSVPGLEEALTKLRGMGDTLLPAMQGMEEMLGGLNSIKQELMAEIRQLSMQHEIAQLKAMLTQQNALIRNLSSGEFVKASANNDEELEPSGEVLNQKMASVKKLKSKGIF